MKNPIKEIQALRERIDKLGDRVERIVDVVEADHAVYVALLETLPEWLKTIEQAGTAAERTRLELLDVDPKHRETLGLDDQK